LNELPDNGWKLWSIDSLLYKSVIIIIIIIIIIQLSRNHAAVDSVYRVAVENLVLSYEESQKGIGQLVRFRMKLPFSIQVYTEK